MKLIKDVHAATSARGIFKWLHPPVDSSRHYPRLPLWPPFRVANGNYIICIKGLEWSRNNWCFFKSIKILTTLIDLGILPLNVSRVLTVMKQCGSRCNEWCIWLTFWYILPLHILRITCEKCFPWRETKIPVSFQLVATLNSGNHTVNSASQYRWQIILLTSWNPLSLSGAHGGLMFLRALTYTSGAVMELRGRYATNNCQVLMVLAILLVKLDNANKM